jgi:hypothetical protein
MAVSRVDGSKPVCQGAGIIGATANRKRSNMSNDNDDTEKTGCAFTATNGYWPTFKNKKPPGGFSYPSREWKEATLVAARQKSSEQPQEKSDVDGSTKE